MTTTQKGPADAPPTPHQTGEEAPGPQLRERQLNTATPTGSPPPPITTAPVMRAPACSPQFGTQPHTPLGLDHFLQQPLDDPTNKPKTIRRTQRLTPTGQ